MFGDTFCDCSSFAWIILKDVDARVRHSLAWPARRDVAAGVEDAVKTHGVAWLWGAEVTPPRYMLMLTRSGDGHGDG